MKQTTQTSGAAAILASLLDGLGAEPASSRLERELAARLPTGPRTGTDAEALVALVRADPRLRYRAHGEGGDSGGVGIARIRHWRTGAVQEVLRIGAEADGRVLLLDPLDGRLHRRAPAQLDWVAADGSPGAWCIDLALAPEERARLLDALAASGPDTRTIHIIKGRDDGFSTVLDTVSYLTQRYLAAGRRVMQSDDSELNIQDGELHVGVVRINDGDQVWVKMDPRQHEGYFLRLRLLVPFEDRVEFINRPSVILAYDDKTITTAAGVDGRRALLSDPALTGPTLHRFGGPRVVVKRMNGFGGYDVRFAARAADAVATHFGEPVPYIIEPSLAGDGLNVDTRLFWYRGALVGAIDRTNTGERLCNISQDGGFGLGDVDRTLADPGTRRDIERISGWLSDKGIVIAGIDVLNGRLVTEVNISNPSVFKNYIELSGHDFLD